MPKYLKFDNEPYQTIMEEIEKMKALLKNKNK